MAGWYNSRTGKQSGRGEGIVCHLAIYKISWEGRGERPSRGPEGRSSWRSPDSGPPKKKPGKKEQGETATVVDPVRAAAGSPVDNRESNIIPYVFSF